MEGLGLLGLHIASLRGQVKVTVLHRPGGVWHRIEIDRLVKGLNVAVSLQGNCPEYVIIDGHHAKPAVLEAMGGGVAFTATQLTGLDNPELPFTPAF